MLVDGNMRWSSNGDQLQNHASEIGLEFVAPNFDTKPILFCAARREAIKLSSLKEYYLSLRSIDARDSSGSDTWSPLTGCDPYS